MHRAGKILRRVDLDPVDTMQLRFAHGRTCEPWPIDVLVLREAFKEAYGLIVRIVIRRTLVKRLPNDLHARALDETRIDRITEVNSIETASRIHIENSGEARFQ